MKKKIIKIIGLIIVLLCLGFLGFIGKASFDGLTNIASREETQKNMNSYRDKYESFAKGKSIEEIKIKSSQKDHDIPAIFIKNPDAKGLAVMVHGMGGTKYSLYSPGQAFYDLGYSLLIYDQRNSGDNEATYNTFGILESFDALDAISYGKNTLDAQEIILYGESYGGATALIAASRDSSLIDYLILDSPVSDSNEFADKVYKQVEEEQGLPIGLMKFMTNIFLKAKLGFTLKDIDVSKWAKEADINSPVLIINSDNDKVTPVHMGEDIYKSIRGDKKEIYTAKGFGHTKFAEENPQGFKDVISNFLKNYRN